MVGESKSVHDAAESCRLVTPIVGLFASLFQGAMKIVDFLEDVGGDALEFTTGIFLLLEILF